MSNEVRNVYTHYERMAWFLWSSKDDIIPLTFDEIARIISGDLPKSATNSRESWSNNPGGFGMTRMWLAAGYKTSRVDVGGTASHVRTGQSECA